ncbi:MAG TPA: thioredoxin domain-containing protein [Xanthobacteraceae bacterium]|nr:thioredoxin domain-containing protein [Xanthobacteraceae bacterium]
MNPMTAPNSAPHENRLAHETSPYLLQHKNNPVDWWPWGPDALREAKRANKPILLSIGYAACHWCHVMAHESFEDEQVAAVMNQLFVNIKVDREERPDIDQIYMTALHHLGEQGGWPLTMFLTPDGEPVWGGTYFPKTARYGRPGFTDVMKEIARLFRDEPQRIEHNRSALMTALATRSGPTNQVVIGAAELDSAAVAIARAFDQTNGGLGRAPKFPQCSVLELLWRAGLRRRESRFFELVELTLEHMSEGGIYDHLGGGFSRYSVDEKWLVPHFEKMLYDNAQLLELLALAYRRTGRKLFLQRAQETVDWLARDMSTPEGAFCASLDADSEGCEGKFYVWSRAEIEEVLGANDADYFAHCYDVTPEGNFEGQNILNRLDRLPKVTGDPAHSGSRQPHHAEVDEDVRLAGLRSELLAVRNKRVRPGLDDKVLADWNGLMIAALANAGIALDQPHWLAIAQRAFGFIERRMTRGDRLGHSWRDGKLLYPGLASDHAAMVKAALALHEATGIPEYLGRAFQWQKALDRHYIRKDTGGYYLTADDAEGLVVRPDSTIDEATPNPNGVAAQNLIRLAVLTGDEIWRERADILFDGLLPIATQSMYLHASLMNALDLRLRAIEIVAVGPQADRFAAAASEWPFLERVVVRAAKPEDLPPAHSGRAVSLHDGQTAALVCLGQRCSLPVIDPQQLIAVIAAAGRDNTGPPLSR